MPGPATSSLTWKVLVASRHTHTMNGQIDRFVEAGETQAAQMTRRKWQSSSPASSQPPPHLAPGPQGTKGGGALAGRPGYESTSLREGQAASPTITSSCIWPSDAVCTHVPRGDRRRGRSGWGSDGHVCVCKRTTRKPCVCACMSVCPRAHYSDGYGSPPAFRGSVAGGEFLPLLEICRWSEYS